MPRRPTAKPAPPKLPKDPSNPSPLFGRTYPKEVYTKSEIEAMLAATSSRAPTAIRNKALVATLWQSGLRIAELLALEPVDFDLDSAQIHVRRGKNGKERFVQTGPLAVETTRAWLVKRSTLNINSRFLFCTLEGGPLKTSYVRTMLGRLGRKAGVQKRVHAHGFRHTYAVHLSKTLSAAHIQRLLGHDSLETTSIYLAGISTDDIREAMKRVEW